MTSPTNYEAKSLVLQRLISLLPKSSDQIIHSAIRNGLIPVAITETNEAVFYSPEDKTYLTFPANADSVSSILLTDLPRLI